MSVFMMMMMMMRGTLSFIWGENGLFGFSSRRLGFLFGGLRPRLWGDIKMTIPMIRKEEGREREKE
jgi:hypothetical protein